MYKVIPPFSYNNFISKVDKTECWNWSASKDKRGYGKFAIGGVSYLAHRVSYSIFKRQPLRKLVVDHICRNKSCVNPEHLRQMSMFKNTDGNRIKTHCRHGHEYSKENTYIQTRGGRGCKKCLQIRNDNAPRKTNLKRGRYVKVKS